MRMVESELGWAVEAPESMAGTVLATGPDMCGTTFVESAVADVKLTVESYIRIVRSGIFSISSIRIFIP